MRKFIDLSFFQNPLFNYLKWLTVKVKYQIKYWGKHLRIGYMAGISDVSFGKYNWIGNDVIISNSNIGDYTYFSQRSIILNAQIGKFCSVGPNVMIAPGRHPTHTFITTHPSFFYNPDNLLNNFVNKTIFKYYDEVVVGNDVWIGANVVIVDGVKIGDGAIIAANSVVTKDVEPYAIVGGLPAKFIKKRFADKEIDTLIEFKWWDRDEHWLKHNVSKFWNINTFLDYVRQKA